MRFCSDIVGIRKIIFHRKGGGKHWTTLPREAVEPPPLQILMGQSSEQPQPAQKLAVLFMGV